MVKSPTIPKPDSKLKIPQLPRMQMSIVEKFLIHWSISLSVNNGNESLLAIDTHYKQIVAWLTTC